MGRDQARSILVASALILSILALLSQLSAERRAIELQRRLDAALQFRHIPPSHLPRLATSLLSISHFGDTPSAGRREAMFRSINRAADDLSVELDAMHVSDTAEAGPAAYRKSAERSKSARDSIRLIRDQANDALLHSSDRMMIIALLRLTRLGVHVAADSALDRLRPDSATVVGAIDLRWSRLPILLLSAISLIMILAEFLNARLEWRRAYRPLIYSIALGFGILSAFQLSDLEALSKRNRSLGYLAQRARNTLAAQRALARDLGELATTTNLSDTTGRLIATVAIDAYESLNFRLQSDIASTGISFGDRKWVDHCDRSLHLGQGWNVGWLPGSPYFYSLVPAAWFIDRPLLPDSFERDVWVLGARDAHEREDRRLLLDETAWSVRAAYLANSLRCGQAAIEAVLEDVEIQRFHALAAINDRTTIENVYTLVAQIFLILGVLVDGLRVVVARMRPGVTARSR